MVKSPQKIRSTIHGLSTQYPICVSCLKCSQESVLSICTVYYVLPSPSQAHARCVHARTQRTHYTHYTLHTAQGNCFAIYYHGVTAQHSSYLKTFPVTEMKPHLQLLPYNITCSWYGVHSYIHSHLQL